MRNRLDLMGKVVVITGGGRGIGAATAREFVSRGARVALGDIDVPLAKAAADEIGCGTIGLHLDVTDRRNLGVLYVRSRSVRTSCSTLLASGQ